MNKKSVSVPSNVLDISAVDPWEEITSANLSKILDVNPSSILRAANSGKITREKNGKIILAKNAVYISSRFAADRVRMTSTQHGYFIKFFDRVKAGPPKPTTSTAQAPEARPYSPDLLSPDAIFEIGTLGKKNQFIPLLKIYTGDNQADGIQIVPLSRAVLEIDAAGQV
ncbi:MAG TPA: hypothetical protein PLI62_18850, partial [Spirochaetota bacterium]|nr:hypothetical protein [Spirochaetota bacterium]